MLKRLKQWDTNNAVIVTFSLLFVQCGGIIEGEQSQDLCMTKPTGSPEQNAMKDGWSKTGLILRGGGIERIGDFTMQAKFSAEEGGSGAQYYTLQFGVSQLPADGVFDAVAEVIWSTEGKDVRRLISVGNGVSISGTAQFARVSVYDRTNLSVFPGVTKTQYRVDALITPGCRPSVQMPPRLFPETNPGVNIGGFYLVPAAGTALVTIPQNAGVISLKADVRAVTGFAPVIAGDMALAFATPGLVDLGEFDPATVTDWIPIPPGAQQLAISNLTVAKNINLFIAFGIEG